MKVFIAVLAILAVAYGRKIDMDEIVKTVENFAKNAEMPTEQNIDYGLKESTQQIEMTICRRNGSKLYEAVLEAISCTKKDRPTGAICDSYNAQFKKCVVPIEKVFAECTDAKLHDIPKLIVDSLTLTMEYLCKSKVRDVVELFNPCIAGAQEQMKGCYAAVQMKYADFGKITNLKTEICSDFIKNKECILQAINGACPNDITQKNWREFYEATAVKPCQA